jgi:hypothetical protein
MAEGQIKYINVHISMQSTQQYLVFKNKVETIVSTFVFIDATSFDPYTGPSSGVQCYKYQITYMKK